MSEPLGRFSTASTLGRGLTEAPVLRNGLVVTWMFAAVGAASRVIVPITIQQAIDRGIDHTTESGAVRVDMRFIVVCGVIAVLAQCVAAVSQRTAIIRLGMRSEQALSDLRSRLVGHIHQLSIADHNEEQRGSLVARVTSDIETLARFFQWGGLAWLIDGTLMVIIAAVMLAYNWLLALIAFGIAIPLFLLLQYVQRHLIANYERSRERNGELLATIGEVVSGNETIQAYHAAHHFRRRTYQAAKSAADSKSRAQLLGAALFPVGEVFSVITIATIVAVGVALGPASGLTAGALVGFIFLTYRFLEPIAEITEVLDQTQAAVAGLRRLIVVLDIEPGPPAAAEPQALPAGRLAIDIDDVSFAYRGRTGRDLTGRDVSGRDVSGRLSDDVVLEHITAHIPAGQQVALVGATGSGKTTLGRLIARLADPVSGTIRLGRDSSMVPLPLVSNVELRQRLVVVAQEPFLFDDTIAANVRFARPDATLAEIEAIVDSLDVRTWVDGLAEGLHTRVGQRGDSLSAGERQLVALLRAGLADPDVLVLDEATSSVDALTEVQISHALVRLMTGRTSIAIAHRLSTAARADRVIVLDRGRIVQDGPHLDLVAQPGIYRDMFDAWITATASHAVAS